MISAKIAIKVGTGILGAIATGAMITKGIKKAKEIKESYENEKKELVDDYIAYVEPDISIEDADKLVRKDLKKIMALSGIVEFITSVFGFAVDIPCGTDITRGPKVFLTMYLLDIVLEVLSAYSNMKTSETDINMIIFTKD